MRKYVGLLLILLLVASYFILTIKLGESDLSTKDSSALHGGRLESGYPSGGYLVSSSPGSQKICGITFLTSSQAVTAAHCVKPSETLSIGTGSIVNIKGEIIVNNYNVPQDWNNKSNENDIAIVNYDHGQELLGFADIATPKSQCKYTILAYGQSGDTKQVNNLSNYKRKSAKVCINSISESVFKFTSNEGGICFGDSGAPIYEEETNKIVGVLSAIITPKGTKEPCYIGNVGVAVRLDTKIKTTGSLLAFTTSEEQKQLASQLGVDEENIFTSAEVFVSEGWNNTKSLFNNKIVLILAAFFTGVIAILSILWIKNIRI